MGNGRNWARIALLGVIGGVFIGAVGCGGSRAIVTAPEVAQRAVPVSEEPDTTEPEGVSHVVSSGQTLFSIARAYGVTVAQLTAANDLADPNVLNVGQSLFVPGVRTTLSVPVAAHPSASKHDLLWPVPGGSILSYFGAPRGKRRHEGLDIRGRPGQPVVAVAAGRVVYSDDRMRGYGKTIIIDHGNGMQSLYAHNSKLLVQKGDRVQRGQSVARIGRSGNASTEHCHLEIRQNDVPRDPLLFVASRAGSRR